MTATSQTASAPKHEPWTTPRVIEALRTRYAPPAFALLTEVPDGTGTHKVRTADAIAMSLWPSRGLTLHGFEVKVSRGDWLKELANPQKAERFWRYCDFWWLVVGDASIVKDVELPPTWGLFVPRGDRLHVAREAVLLEPEPIGRPFLAALFRKVAEAACSPDDLQQRLDAARREGAERHRSRLEFDLKQLRERHQELVKQVNDFQAASGITIAHRWGPNAQQVGQAVRLVVGGDKATKESLQQLTRIRQQLQHIDASITEVLDGHAAAIDPNDL